MKEHSIGKGTSSAKGLRKEHTQSVKGRGRRTDWLRYSMGVGDEIIELIDGWVMRAWDQVDHYKVSSFHSEGFRTFVGFREEALASPDSHFIRSPEVF